MSDIDGWVEKRACSKNGTRNMSEIKALNTSHKQLLVRPVNMRKGVHQSSSKYAHHKYHQKVVV